MPLSLRHTHSSKFVRERTTSAPERREKQLFGFYTALVEFYTEEVLRGFLPCGFPKENICVLCVSVHVVLSVILLVKNVLRYHLSN